MPTGSISRLELAVVVLMVGATAAIGVWVIADEGPPDRLVLEWESETTTEYAGNHHELAVASVDGDPVIGVPRNDLDGSDACGIVALDAGGTVRWARSFPPKHCTPHAVGDLAVGDLAGDGRPAFVAGTEQERAFGFDAATGDRVFELATTSIGYAAPVVTDVTGDGSAEVVVVDFAGLLQVVEPDGSTRWTRELGGRVLVDPIAADVTDDGDIELLVTTRPSDTRMGELLALTADGDVAWTTTLAGHASSMTLLENGRLVVASRDGTVAAYDATTGDRRWAVTVEAIPHVGGAVNGTVTVAASDGRVLGFDGADGTVLWERRIGTDETRQIHAPVAADVTGDERPEVIVAARDGTVAVLDPNGSVLARSTAAPTIGVSPTVADVTGDGTNEVLVLYGDARVAALRYEPA